jgi:hypothetical protein
MDTQHNTFEPFFCAFFKSRKLPIVAHSFVLFLEFENVCQQVEFVLFFCLLANKLKHSFPMYISLETKLD